MSKPSWIGYTLGGRYKIESLLGQGGMSSVYKGVDPNLRRTVAIKLVHAHLAADPEFVRRFEGEAAAVAQLRHPNIIQVFDFNHDGDTYYMVLEYLEGQTLGDTLVDYKDSDGMPIVEVVRIMQKLASAVHYAHNNGIVHRDLKPANVMIQPNGEPTLMDFGIVKMLQSDHNTASGVVMGTMSYMSPEQIRGERIDNRTDVYSLGVMLFEMLSGRKPFEGESSVTTMIKHLNEPPPQLHLINPNIPKALCDVVNKTLEKDADDRYQTAAEFAMALAPFGTQSVGTSTLGNLPIVPDPGSTMIAPVMNVDSTMMASQPATIVTAAQAAAPLGAQTGVSNPPEQPLPEPAAARSAGGSTNWMMLGGIGALVAIVAIVLGIFAFGGGGDEETGGLAAAEITQTADAVLLAQVDEATDTPLPPPTDAPTETPIPEPTATTPPTATSEPTPDVAATGTADQILFLAADNDGDGLTNEFELGIGTNIDSGDTDNDGVPDGAENGVQCLDPLNPDSDGDGIIDNLDTDPCVAETPTATATPSKAATITGISIENSVYIVQFQTVGYQPTPGDFHVHFYFNNITEENAGVGGTGPWEVYQGASPFTRFALANRPADATQLCVIVATPSHTIELGSGNCFNLPES